MVAAQPLWAKLFYLVRTGHAREALDEALAHRQAIEHREDSFVAHFRIWVESPDHRFVVIHPLPRSSKSQLNANHLVYQNLIETISKLFITPICYIRRVLIRSSSPFISSSASWTRPNALYHLSQQQLRIGSGSSSRWHVLPLLNFIRLIELVQIDEEENGGLRGLAEVLLNYGERHFEGAPGSKGTRTGLWAAVLLTCGEFERVSDPGCAFILC